MRYLLLAAHGVLLCPLLCGCAERRPPDLVVHFPDAHDEFAKADRERSLKPIGDAGPCLLHGTPQQLDRVPILYGYITFAPGYIESWRKQFPNARLFMLGGCTTYPGMPHLQTIYYCPDCREAEKQWTPPDPRPAEPDAEPADATSHNRKES